METRLLLKAFLVTGKLNVAQSEAMKAAIFDECCMLQTNANDRATWSNWINAKCTPNRLCRIKINEALTKNGYKPIYKIKSGKK